MNDFFDWIEETFPEANVYINRPQPGRYAGLSREQELCLIDHRVKEMAAKGFPIKGGVAMAALFQLQKSGLSDWSQDDIEALKDAYDAE